MHNDDNEHKLAMTVFSLFVAFLIFCLGVGFGNGRLEEEIEKREQCESAVRTYEILKKSRSQEGG